MNIFEWTRLETLNSLSSLTQRNTEQFQACFLQIPWNRFVSSAYKKHCLKVHLSIYPETGYFFIQSCRNKTFWISLQIGWAGTARCCCFAFLIFVTTQYLRGHGNPPDMPPHFLWSYFIIPRLGPPGPTCLAEGSVTFPPIFLIFSEVSI